MGLHTPYESLTLRWAALSHDATLHDLPFKIELNGYGTMEIRSPSNTDAEMDLKRRVYLAAGAVEGWIVADDGTLTVFDASGQRAASRFGVQLALDGPR